MTSKAERRRRKKARAGAAGGFGNGTSQNTTTATRAPRTATTAMPTPERMARGKWALPTGQDKRHAPPVDLASDMIGALFQAGKLTSSQEQAARTFQALRAAYQADLGIVGYRSCLAGGVGGHDSGEGDPAIKAAHDAMCDSIGRVKVALLDHEIAKGADKQPNNLAALRVALDCVANRG